MRSMREAAAAIAAPDPRPRREETMRLVHHLTLSAAIVAVTAAGTLLDTGSAEAASRVEISRPQLADKSLHHRRGPFFGLRVNSFDVDAEAKVTGCYTYKCPPIVDDGPRTRYHVVRSIQKDDDVRVTDCDEVLIRAFGGREVSFSAFVRSVRWIRDIGPNGRTPVGGFLARMDLDATFAAGPGGSVTFGMLDYSIIGTQGLRPRRGDVSTTPDADETSRCDAPFHDEGYYEARVDRKGARLIQRLFGDDNVLIRRLKRLNKSVIVGTLEGRTDIRDDSRGPYDFCALNRVTWWFDGLVGYRCRKLPEPAVDTRPVDQPEPVEAD